MQKVRPLSPRFRLWIAGIVILAGALVLASTWYQQSYWWVLHPVPSGWHTHSDRTYSGVLSETNQSVVVPIEGFVGEIDSVFVVMPWGRLCLPYISTNDTPITLTVRDWNNTVILQLPNCTGETEFGYTSLALYAALGHNEFLSKPTLTIARETGDVTFAVRVVVESRVYAVPAPPPFLLFLSSYVFSLAAICSGFAIIEHVLRDIHRGLV